VAGAGFEAEVAHKFGREGVRGLKGYAKTIIQCFDKRSEKKVRLLMDGKESFLPFFSLSIANGAQWGNNFEIASNADIQDGYLDVAIMRKPRIHQIPRLIRYLRSKNQKDSSLFSYFKAEKIDINKSGKYWHIDGEPVLLKKTKTVTVSPKSLKIIVPK
ncbi:MAG: diacylglycerol/lipid kinase family protein, partial [Bacteroidia bacterium]